MREVCFVLSKQRLFLLNNTKPHNGDAMFLLESKNTFLKYDVHEAQLTRS